MVDRLTPGQAKEIRRHLLRLVKDQEDQEGELGGRVRPVPRHLSFIGLIHAEPDLAERSEDLLRRDFGH